MVTIQIHRTNVDVEMWKKELWIAQETVGEMEEEEVRRRAGDEEDEEWVTEDRVNLDRKKEKSTETGRAPQTGDKQHKHMTTHTYIHLCSISDSTQTSQHLLFQLCMLCSVSPPSHSHPHTHSLLFHSLSLADSLALALTDTLAPIHDSTLLTHRGYAAQSMLSQVTQQQNVV